MPTPVPGLPSPHAALDGLAYFPRMLAKIRLHAAKRLPEAYVPYLGDAPDFGGHVFDARCCRLLGVAYEALKEKTLAEGADDADVLAWARTAGRNPTVEQVEVWSGYASKRGWRDDASPSMRKWAEKLGADPDAVTTWFDGMDVDEGLKRAGEFAPEPFRPGPFAGTATAIPGLPSPYEAADGVIYFPRMAAKIALHAAGKLPEAWAGSMGWGGAGDPATSKSFDAFCCRFLGIDYAALQARVLSGETDPAALLAWIYETTGKKPTDEERTIWSAYLRKRGWRDVYHARLVFRLEESGFPADAAATMFDFIELDEGRPVLDPGGWVK